MSESDLRPNAADLADTRGTLSIFVALNSVPLVLYLLGKSVMDMGIILCVALVMAFLNFIMCKNSYGRVLVGLSWRVESEFKLAYDIEPDPFVPKKINSNCFWIALVGCVLFWAIMTLQQIVSSEVNHWICGLLSVLITAVYSVNFVIFFKAQQVASKQSAEAVRQVLLGQNTAFPDAAEVLGESDDSDSNDEEESNDQEEVV